MIRDYDSAYRILNLQPGADFSEVKSAYRALTKELHPDNLILQDESSKERLLLVTEAYDLLEQKEAREKAAAKIVSPAGDSSPQKTQGPRILGTPVSYHVTSAEERARRRQRENDYRKEMAKKRSRLREEAAARAEELKRENLQKQKEKALLNEIRMIRLAHIIEATIAADAKKGQKT
jgi:DnaJ-class molecular chaperone